MARSTLLHSHECRLLVKHDPAWSDRVNPGTARWAGTDWVSTVEPDMVLCYRGQGHLPSPKGVYHGFLSPEPKNIKTTNHTLLALNPKAQILVLLEFLLRPNTSVHKLLPVSQDCRRSLFTLFINYLKQKIFCIKFF